MGCPAATGQNVAWRGRGAGVGCAPFMKKPASNTQGICHLAGAGPGDLGLVTLRVKEVVERAEVV